MKQYKPNREVLIKNLQSESRGLGRLARWASQRKVDWSAPNSPMEIDMNYLEATLGATSHLLNEAANFIEDNIKAE